MKVLYVLLIGWLSLGVSLQAESGRRLGEDLQKTAPEPTAEYVEIYQEAVKAFNAGNLDDAEQQVGVVLGKYPHYKPASNLQSRIMMVRRNDTSGVLKRKLEAIVIPRVNFRDALVENALDFLRDEMRRLDRDKKGVNIVPNIPDDIKKRKITLDLVDVSAGELLKYISEVGGFHYRVERSAVIVYTDEPTKPGTPAASATVAADPAQPPLPVIPGGP